MEGHVPGKRVVDLLDERKVADSFSTQRWCQLGSEVFELLKMFSKFNIRYVVDDVQQSDTGTCVVCSLHILSIGQ